MTSIRLRLNKSHRAGEERCSLVFLVNHNHRSKQFQTGIHLYENDFDVQHEAFLTDGSSHFSPEDINEMQERVTLMRDNITALATNLDATDEAYAMKDLVLDDIASAPSSLYLIKEFDAIILRKETEGNYGMASAFRSSRRSLERFLNGTDIDLSQVNVQFLRDYETFLLNEGVSRNTAAYYLRNVRSLFNSVARANRAMLYYPFKTFKIAPSHTVHRSLDRDSLLKLTDAKFGVHERHLEFARDIFLFSFYTRGMSLVDIIFLKKSDIVGGVINYLRHKSKQPMRIAIIEPLTALIEKYRNESLYVLPIIKSDSSKNNYTQYRLALSRINRNLKVVGERLGFTEKLTTDVARHSWAVRAQATGSPVSVISEGLGHSSEKITKLYLSGFGESSIDRLNDEVVKLR